LLAQRSAGARGGVPWRRRPLLAAAPVTRDNLSYTRLAQIGPEKRRARLRRGGTRQRVSARPSTTQKQIATMTTVLPRVISAAPRGAARRRPPAFGAGQRSA